MDTDDTPLQANELAKILRENFPAASATKVGQTLLEPTVFPNTSRASMADALSFAGFEDSDAEDAVDVLYPLTLTVQSTQAWQATGIVLTGRLSTQISYIEGKWSVGSWADPCDANGLLPQYIAPSGYALPGTNQGALIGRVGDNAPFLVASSAQAPAGQVGMLFLCINDDLDARYGKGLSDNSGTLSIRVSCS